MITYRDMTFCSALCATEECSRQYTEQIRKEAINSGLPVIAFCNFSESCEDYKPREDNEEGDSKDE